MVEKVKTHLYTFALGSYVAFAGLSYFAMQMQNNFFRVVFYLTQVKS